MICSKPYDLEQKKVNGRWKTGRYDANGDLRAQINDLKILERKALFQHSVALLQTGQALSGDRRLRRHPLTRGQLGHPVSNQKRTQLQQSGQDMTAHQEPACGSRIRHLHLKKYFAELPWRASLPEHQQKLRLFHPGQWQIFGMFECADHSQGFIQSKKPILDAQNRVRGWKKFGRFVLNQDTGGAIKGAGRGDIYKTSR